MWYRKVVAERVCVRVERAFEPWQHPQHCTARARGKERQHEAYAINRKVDRLGELLLEGQGGELALQQKKG